MYENLDQLIAYTETLATGKADYEANVKELSFNGNQLTVPVNGLFGGSTGSPTANVILTPEDWAYRQMFSRLGTSHFGKGSQKGLPFDYLMAHEPEYRGGILNHHLASTSSATGSSIWFLRGHDDTCRAVLSSKYTVVDNDTLLKKIATELKNQQLPEFKIVSGTSVNRDDLHLKTVWRNRPGEGGQTWGAGLAVYNGETGRTPIGAAALIKRGSCDNSIVVDLDSNYKARHAGDAHVLYAGIFGVMAHALKESFKWIDKMIAAEKVYVPNFAKLMDDLCNDYGWEGEMKSTILLGTEGKQTIGGAINGVTFAAHTMGLDPKDQFSMEMVGGKLLADDFSLFAVAARKHHSTSSWQDGQLVEVR